MTESTRTLTQAPAATGGVAGARLRAGHFVQQQLVRRARSYGLTVLGDLLVVTVAYEAATVVRFVDSPVALKEMRELAPACLLAGGIYAAVAYALGLHRRLWRYASLQDGFALIRAVSLVTLLVAALDLVMPFSQRGTATPARILPLSVILGGACLSFLFLGSLKMLPRVVSTRHSAVPAPEDCTRVLIVGAGQAGAILAGRMLVNHAEGYRIVGFVDDDPAKWHGRIRDVPILGPTEHIPALAAAVRVDLIAIAMPSASRERISELIGRCQQTSASIKIFPGLAQVVGRQSQMTHLRDVDVADLLGRPVVPLRSPQASAFLAGKRILVTGAAGSIGSELCRQLVSYQPACVIALDNNETGLFDLAAGLSQPEARPLLRPRIADIANGASMARCFAEERPQVIFHAAAYKHVPLLESQPEQAIRTNVLATYELCKLAARAQVEVFVFVSSDKAADPVSILGASKRAGEQIVQAMAMQGQSPTRFCAVRFGNVIGSRGSVVPLFLRQIEQGGPVTVTDPEATRYFMTIPEACGLVILTSALDDGAGLCLLDMGQPVRIGDLATRMIRMRGLRVGRDIAVVHTGLRPGERQHEVLAGADEQLRASSHAGILRVVPTRPLPTLPELRRQLRDMRACLEQGDVPTLRRRLFELVGAGAPPPRRSRQTRPAPHTFQEEL
jgi:FlaA1/EpsC-like NDP-sugar epimerase